MTSLELEAGRMELIRDIMSINNTLTLENLKKYIKELLKRDTAIDSATLTDQMLKKYAGSWKDTRTSDEVINEIYAARRSQHVTAVSPFDV